MSSTQRPPNGAQLDVRLPQLQLVAILVTDLVGFSSLVEQLGDARSCRIVAAHNQLLRACLANANGQEWAHTGDGVMAVFRSVTSALACAIQMQRNLLARAWRKEMGAELQMRVGVHAGEPRPEEGRFFGTSVNTTVRICAAAEPCCIVVSDLARALAAGSDFAFVPRGTTRLKGLVEPLLLHDLLWSRPGPDTCRLDAGN